jgi:pimeloyl-ACP methyl ester carboxylesterase
VVDNGSGGADEEAAISVRQARGVAWPLTFQAGSATCSAFFHPASGTSWRDTAVVLCNPIGWEAVAAHRTYRHLAERLSKRGFPVLRFDYPGTGDSSDDDSDPDRVGSWRAGVRAAVRTLGRLSGCQKVALFGVHLGATLAALAARDLGGVEALVLWAPYAKGRAFVREAKAYRALNGADTGFPRAEDEGGLEAAGFLLSADTLSDLAALDLLTDARSPAQHVLLLERDEATTGAPLAARLGELGARVEHGPGAGYQDMMQEPRKTIIPERTLASVVAYLDATCPPVDAPSSASVPPGTYGTRLELRTAGGEALREEALTFGANGELFGILCEPTSATAERPKVKTAVLFLTTAAHHRIGPNRMYVPMARDLARRGFSSLRFDLTGVGDSPVTVGVVEGHPYSPSFVNDVRAAMDHLQRAYGFERFVTIGLCSGAYLGFHASIADPRIVGAILINPQTFNWREGDSLEINRRTTFMSSRYYKRASMSPKTWRRVLRGEVNVRGIATAVMDRWKKRAGVEMQRFKRKLGVADASGRVDVADAFQALLKRGADMLLIYSGDDEGLDYLASEAGSRLKQLQKRAGFRVEILDGPDHTFTQLWAQQRLMALVLEHVVQRFGER